MLKDLEVALEENHLLVGEKLLDEGKVTSLSENGRHFWLAAVDGFEVEVQISPSRVRAVSCDCSSFQRERFCGHVAAALLLLRRQLADKQLQKNEGRHTPRQHAYQKLTVNAILECVNPDELAAFVRYFAKFNKPFSLALKARFAARVPMGDSFQKYGQVLDTALSGGRKANDRISASGAALLLRTIQELLNQADDAVALEHFGEAWAICWAVLDRIPPIANKLDSEEKALHQAVFDTLLKQKKLAMLPVPPSLREEILAFCLDRFARPAFKLNGFAGPLLDTAISLSQEQDGFQTILESIDNELIKSTVRPDFRKILLLFKLQLLQLPALHAAAHDFDLDCLADEKKLLEAVETAFDAGEPLLVQGLAEKGARLTKSPAVREQLEVVLLALAELTGNNDQLVPLARSRFLITKDFHFLDVCRANLIAGWPVFVREILAELVAQPNFQANVPVIAQLLGREGLYQELVALLEKQASIEFAMKFDAPLFKSAPEALLNLYDQLLVAYLTQHFGPKANEKLKSVMLHLGQHLGDKMASRLFSAIQMAFPGRSFEAVELAVF